MRWLLMHSSGMQIRLCIPFYPNYVEPILAQCLKFFLGNKSVLTLFMLRLRLEWVKNSKTDTISVSCSKFGKWWILTLAECQASEIASARLSCCRFGFCKLFKIACCMHLIVPNTIVLKVMKSSDVSVDFLYARVEGVQKLYCQCTSRVSNLQTCIVIW